MATVPEDLAKRSTAYALNSANREKPAAKRTRIRKLWAVSGHSEQSMDCANRCKLLISEGLEEEGVRCLPVFKTGLLS